eukprot:8443802-Alexandrium_andersonii.AAC.1
MSASLVGSEMCIRDRTLPACFSSGVWMMALANPTPDEEAIVRDRAKPVSYTHLTLPTICSV